MYILNYYYIYVGKFRSQLYRDIPYAIFTLVSYEVLQKIVTSAIQIRTQEYIKNNKEKSDTEG